MSRLRIYFAADIHGSDICFKKFLKAPAHYGAHIGVLGGDLSGKTMVVVTIDNTGTKVARIGSETFRLTTQQEYDDFSSRLADAGIYCHVMTPNASDARLEDTSDRREQFENKIVEVELRSRMRHWIALAEAETKNSGGSFYWLPGNDDPYYLDDLFSSSSAIRNLDGSSCSPELVVDILGLGGSNRTPWETPREYDESELADRLSRLFGGPKDSRKSRVLVSHVPPHSSGLDLAPALDPELRVRYGPGGVLTTPVGSIAVREAIQRYKPLLVLCGHVHDSGGFAKVAGTMCINPGSTYSSGILRGAIVEVANDKVVDFQLVEG